MQAPLEGQGPIDFKEKLTGWSRGLTIATARSPVGKRIAFLGQRSITAEDLVFQSSPPLDKRGLSQMQAESCIRCLVRAVQHRRALSRLMGPRTHPPESASMRFDQPATTSMPPAQRYRRMLPCLLSLNQQSQQHCDTMPPPTNCTSFDGLPFPRGREALDFVRAQLPTHEPHRTKQAH